MNISQSEVWYEQSYDIMHSNVLEKKFLFLFLFEKYKLFLSFEYENKKKSNLRKNEPNYEHWYKNRVQVCVGSGLGHGFSPFRG